MSTYTQVDPHTKESLNDLLFRFSGAHDEMYQRMIDAGLKIDLLFAHGDRDEDLNLVGDAIKHQGHKALGLCSIINLKDRVAGLGDVRILIDHDWFEKVGDVDAAATPPIRPRKERGDAIIRVTVGCGFVVEARGAGRLKVFSP